MNIPFYWYTRSSHFLISRDRNLLTPFPRSKYVLRSRDCPPIRWKKYVSACLPETRNIRSLFKVAKKSTTKSEDVLAVAIARVRDWRFIARRLLQIQTSCSLQIGNQFLARLVAQSRKNRARSALDDDHVPHCRRATKNIAGSGKRVHAPWHTDVRGDLGRVLRVKVK